MRVTAASQLMAPLPVVGAWERLRMVLGLTSMEREEEASCWMFVAVAALRALLKLTMPSSMRMVPFLVVRSK